MKSMYETLGVAQDALPSDIKAAYRKLVSKAHPDRGGDPVEFNLIQRAYDTLSDLELRTRYDLTGSWEMLTPVETKARDGVMEVFGNLLIRGPAEMDMIAAAHEAVAQARAMHVNMMSNEQRRLAGLESARQRLKFKHRDDPTKTDYVGARLNELYAQSTKALQEMIEHLEVLDLVQRMFDDYEYDSSDQRSKVAYISFQTPTVTQ